MRLNLWSLAIVAMVAVAAPAQQPVARPSPTAELGSNLPAQTLGPNDLIGLSVYEAPELSRSIRVGADGYIRIPMLKQKLKADGLLPAELETVIAQALVKESILVDPHVTVTIAEYQSRPISVTGAVRMPVVFQAEGRPVTLLEAIAKAQGLREDAGAEILVCNAIGANPLLARVCALFHDIGKTIHPAFFTENQRDRANPHDGKDPAVSARIIKQHVPDGVELGRKHNLPRAVIDVIRQHHGTTRVRYFYERALAARTKLSGQPRRGDSEVEAGLPPIQEEAFRYEGPKPQFRESAVISLADGVEAASRSLRSATPEQLGHLIDGIVNERIGQGQLNEAPVTLEDIAKIKNSFTFTLLNMLHSRIAYTVPEHPEGEGPRGGQDERRPEPGGMKAPSEAR